MRDTHAMHRSSPGHSPTYLGVFLFGDGVPDLPPAGVQLLNGQVLLLGHGQRGIVGELCKDFGEVGAPFAGEILPPFSSSSLPSSVWLRQGDEKREK